MNFFLGVETEFLDIFDGGMAIYRGDCNNLILIECDDDGGEALQSKILREDLVPIGTVGYNDADCTLDGNVLIQDYNTYLTNSAHIDISKMRYDGEVF